MYTTTFSGSQEWISEYRRDVEAKTGPLSREIVESQVTSKSGLDALYSKLVSLLVLRSGIGNPTSTRVLREAAAALQSIFPPMALVKFMRQSRLDKRREIRELALVVAGVRIFNWVSCRLIYYSFMTLVQSLILRLGLFRMPREAGLESRICHPS